MSEYKFRPVPDYTPQQIERISSLYNVSSPDECWEWQGHRTPDGYGLYNALLAHRVVYSIRWGVNISNKCLLHRCDNPPCVNPGHCFVGTLADNNKDRQHKGRTVMPKVRARGNKNGRAKLDDKKVADIRRRHAQGETQRGLARVYGVSAMSIWAIVHNHYWHHVI